MAIKYVNNLKTTISDPIGTTDTQVHLDSVVGFPTLGAGDYMYLTLSDPANETNEIVKCTAITNNTLTIERGVDGSTAKAWNFSDNISCRLTAGMLQGVLAELGATKLDIAGDGSQLTNMEGTVRGALSTAGGSVNYLYRAVDGDFSTAGFKGFANGNIVLTASHWTEPALSDVLSWQSGDTPTIGVGGFMPLVYTSTSGWVDNGDGTYTMTGSFASSIWDNADLDSVEWTATVPETIQFDQATGVFSFNSALFAEASHTHTINNNDWSGADLDIVHGGTGASSASGARSNLNVYSKGEVDAKFTTAEVSMFSYEYTATAGQTAFTGVDLDGHTLSYTAGNIRVYLNGIQLSVSEYTATDGTTVNLITGATAGDELVVVAFNSFTVADHYSKAEVDQVIEETKSFATAMAIAL